MTWYCKYCGFGPHDPNLHIACIECGRMNTGDAASLERRYNDLEAQDHGDEIRATNENTGHDHVSFEGSTGVD
ncbi:hypothetical protein BDD12DRAFT_911345 [Trichophaea hybrida]|nr:hypothetical protein BDD12DRAFT_911345 [Trichophaea hybrida]